MDSDQQDNLNLYFCTLFGVKWLSVRSEISSDGFDLITMIRIKLNRLLLIHILRYTLYPAPALMYNKGVAHKK